jgi:putative ABC transport system permease protein
MRALDILRYAAGASKGRKWRSALTTLGVIIGIAAIVSLLSLSQGLQGTVAYQLQAGLATDTLIVTPIGRSSPALLINDSRAVEGIAQVSLAVPLLQRTGVLWSGSSSMEVSVVGVDFASYRAIYGRAFVSQQGDIPSDPSADALVIGASVYDPAQNGTAFAQVGDQVLLSPTAASKEALNVTGYEGRIAAVLREIGPLSAGGLSDAGVYVPLAQAADLYRTSECSLLLVKLRDDHQGTIDAATAAIKDMFHDQVRVTSPKSVHDLVAGVFSTLDLFLMGIAGLSLMVAGVGIMNVMMVSLMERRREIGILKALGMRDRTVLAIFLCEAALIGLVGGVIGAVLGFAAADLIALFLGKVALPIQLGSWGRRGSSSLPSSAPRCSSARSGSAWSSACCSPSTPPGGHRDCCR